MRLTPDRDNYRVAGLVVGGLMGVVAVLTVLALTACDIVKTEGSGVQAMSSASRHVLEHEFSTTGRVSIYSLGAPARVAGIGVGFAAPQAATNVFELYRIRGAVTSLVYSAGFVDAVFVDFGDRLWLKPNDILSYTNTVTNAAVIAFNMD